MHDSVHDSVPAPISDEMVATYARDGVVCLRDIIEPAWIERMRRAVDRVTRSPGPMRESYYPDRPGDFFSEKFLWTVDDDFRAYVFESPVAAVAGRIMASAKVNLFYDHLLVKEPGTPSETDWHQDMNFWPFEGHQICSVWAPLDTVSHENGTLEFVRESHSWYHKPMARVPLFGDRDGQPKDTEDASTTDVDDAPPQPDIADHRADFDIVSWALDPGDVLVFQGLTLHYASGNPTSGRRRALSTRWLGDDMRYVRKSKMIQLIRDPGLRPGDAVDCDLFPAVWRSAA